MGARLVITVNNPPSVKTNGGLTVNEGGTGTVGQAALESTDSEESASQLTYTVTALPANGTLKKSGSNLGVNGTFTQADINSGVVTYVHNGSETTADSFAFTVSDGTASVSGLTFAITVTPVNDAPVAVTDVYSTNEDQTLNSAAPGVKANDTDSESDAFNAMKVTDPTHGTLTFNTDGSFSYVPNADYNGTDSFTYKVNDGQDSNAATVTITVNAVNDAPAVATNGGMIVNEGETGTVGQAALESTDIDNNASQLIYTVTILPVNGTLKKNGSDVALNGTFTQDDLNNNRVTYVHNGSETTSDSFAFTVSDGTATLSGQTFAITVTPVNDAPVAVADAYSTNEDQTLTVAAPGVKANDTDSENDAFNALKVTEPAHGTVTVNADGSFNYVPNANYNGPDSFAYKVNDGQDSNAATVTITVNAVNDAPVVAVNGGLTVNEGGTGTVGQAALESTDGDNSASQLTYTVTTLPVNGTLKKNGSNLGMNGTFTQDDLNNSRVTYVHNGSETTADSFGFTLSDGTVGVGGQTFAIVVTPVNDAPVAVADAYSTLRGQALNVAAPGVKANDTDIENDAFNAEKVTDPAHGTLTFNADGSFNYLPISHYTGTDSFTYKVTETVTSSVYSEPATVTINVRAPSSPPPSTPPPSNGDGKEKEEKVEVKIILNGDPNDDSATVTTTTQNEKKVITVIVDEEKMVLNLEKQQGTSVVTIPVNAESDVVVGELDGFLISKMESKKSVIEVVTNAATYRLPAGEIQIDDIAKQLGADKNKDLRDVKIQISIGNVSEDEVQLIEDQAGKGNLTLVAPPVEFKVTAVYGEQSVEVSQFNAFVERTIAIPAGVDPTKITTGVVIGPNGEFIHVPTKIIVKDGKYYAVINSRTNSMYSVIYNKKSFTDLSGHWAKSTVEDMASRLIVTGVSDRQFAPNRNITRAEFTAIVVKALGLRGKYQDGLFKDVRSTDWYADAVAAGQAYHLISGFEGQAFKPNATITRQEAMVILARAMAITKLDADMTESEMAERLSPYNDQDQVASWAKEAAAINIRYGIIQGSSSDLNPQNNLTRAEAAAVVSRLLKQSDLI